MKIMSSIIAVLTLVSTYSLAQEMDTYNLEVGTQTVVRSILEKKLVEKEALKVIANALETDPSSISPMECQRGRATDFCIINILTKDDVNTDEAEETLYQIEVRIQQGNVVSAKMDLIAG